MDALQVQIEQNFNEFLQEALRLDELGLLQGHEGHPQNALPLAEENAQATKPTKRAKLTPMQIAGLERAFQQDNYPGRTKLEELVESLLLDEERIKVWFQNRRRKHLSCPPGNPGTAFFHPPRNKTFGQLLMNKTGTNTGSLVVVLVPRLVDIYASAVDRSWII